MTINLQVQGLGEAIETGDVDYSEDRLALAAIVRSIPPEMLSTVGRKPTTKGTGEAIKIMQMGVDRICEGNTQKLRRDFNNVVFMDGESIDDFYMGITCLVNKLRLLGDTIEEIDVVRKMLQVVPELFDHVVLSIETLLDVKTFSVEEVTRRLHAVEQIHEAQWISKKMGSCLLISTNEDEMIRRMRGREKEHMRGGGDNVGRNVGSSGERSRVGSRQPI